jgi:AraC family transcriptional regulator
MLGMKIITSLEENRTVELWCNFMPGLRKIKHRTGKDFYSPQEYPEEIIMVNFTPQTQFIKWATVQVPDFEIIPPGMDQLIIPFGLYIFT